MNLLNQHILHSKEQDISQLLQKKKISLKNAVQDSIDNSEYLSEKIKQKLETIYKQKDNEQYYRIIKIFDEILKLLYKETKDQNFELMNIDVKFKKNKKNKLIIILPIYSELQTFTWITNIQIDLYQQKLAINHILCYNNYINRVLVTNKYLQLQMSQYFSKINSNLNFGSFTIDFKLGEIQLKTNNIWPPKLFEKQLESDRPGGIYMPQYIYNNLKSSKIILEKFTLQIIFNLNLISFEKFSFLREQQQQHQQSQNKKDQNQYEQFNAVQILKNFSKQIEVLKTREYKHIENSTEISEDDKICQIIDKSSEMRKVYIQLEQKDIYIQVQDSQNQTKLIKQKTDNIDNDIRLRDLLKNESNPYICKYYKDMDDRGTIYTEVLESKNLSSFLQNYSETLSLPQKLRISQQIAQGQAFLIKNKISHQNINPETIQIDKNFTPKISNLQDCYILDQQKKFDILKQQNDFLLATPPEKLNKQIYENSDTFSLAHLFYYFLFQKNPISLKPVFIEGNNDKNSIDNSNKIRMMYQNQKYLIRKVNNLSTTMDTYYTQKYIANYIEYMISMCLEPHATRKKIDFLQDSLKLCYESIEQIF